MRESERPLGSRAPCLCFSTTLQMCAWWLLKHFQWESHLLFRLFHSLHTFQGKSRGVRSLVTPQNIVMKNSSIYPFIHYDLFHFIVDNWRQDLLPRLSSGLLCSQRWPWISSSFLYFPSAGITDTYHLSQSRWCWKLSSRLHTLWINSLPAEIHLQSVGTTYSCHPCFPYERHSTTLDKWV